MIFIYFSNSKTSFSNLSRLFADVTNSKSGYSCDRLSGMCIVSKSNAEYLSENDCLKKCPDSRLKWYCNKTLGQCVRDSRGNYASKDACWKNCYKTLQYYCDMVYGICRPKGNNDSPKYGDNWTGINGVYSMDLEECSQKCRPISNSYTFYPNTKKCLWIDPRQPWSKDNYSKLVKEQWASKNDTTADDLVSATKDLLPAAYFFAKAKDAISGWADYLFYLKTNIPDETMKEKVITWVEIEKQISEQFSSDTSGNSEKNLSWTKCASKAGISDPSTTKIKYSCQNKAAWANLEVSDYGFWTGYFGNIVYADGTSFKLNGPKECYASPTGEYESYGSCFDACYQSPFETYQNYSGWTCNYAQGVCSLTKTNAEFQATTLEDSFAICKNNCAPALDADIIADYKCRTGADKAEEKTKEEEDWKQASNHACLIERLTPFYGSCASAQDCKIHNNWMCISKASDTSTLTKTTFIPISQDVCSKNKWAWLGEIKETCTCKAGQCVVEKGYNSQIKTTAICGDGTCDTIEKYKYLHSGSWVNENSSNTSTVGSVNNKLYCSNDCNN